MSVMEIVTASLVSQVRGSFMTSLFSRIKDVAERNIGNATAILHIATYVFPNILFMNA